MSKDPRRLCFPSNAAHFASRHFTFAIVHGFCNENMYRIPRIIVREKTQCSLYVNLADTKVTSEKKTHHWICELYGRRRKKEYLGLYKYRKYIHIYESPYRVGGITKDNVRQRREQTTEIMDKKKKKSGQKKAPFPFYIGTCPSAIYSLTLLNSFMHMVARPHTSRSYSNWFEFSIECHILFALAIILAA